MEDQELVQGCVQGRKEAWDRLVLRFSKLVYWSIRQTVGKEPWGGTDDFCDEVFQEVFKKLLEKEDLSQLRDAKNLRKFLTVLSCHTAMDRLKSLGRHEKKTVPSENEEGGSFEDLPEFSAIESCGKPLSREREVLMEVSLGNLPPLDRACVEFHYLDGRTHRQIGEFLGLSQDTVSTVIRRAKKKLRRDLVGKGLLEGSSSKRI